MIIVFNCQSCGAILRMKEQYGGQRGRCPHCQGAITVPAIATDEGMDLMPLDESATAAPPVQGTANSPPPPQAPAAGFSLGRLGGAPGASGSPPAQTPASSF